MSATQSLLRPGPGDIVRVRDIDGNEASVLLHGVPSPWPALPGDGLVAALASLVEGTIAEVEWLDDTRFWLFLRRVVAVEMEVAR